MDCVEFELSLKAYTQKGSLLPPPIYKTFPVMQAGLGNGDALRDGCVEAGLGDGASVVDGPALGDGCVEADLGDDAGVGDGCIDPLIIPTTCNISFHTILHPLTPR